MMFMDPMFRDFDPFREVQRMRDEVDRVFSQFGAAPAARDFPPVNMWVGDDSVVVTAEVPGVRPDDLDLTVHEDVLTLRGQRAIAPEPDSAAWHRRERGFGPFVRQVRLPYRVDADKVQARFANGVLEIEMKRPEAERPRRIEIRGS